MKKANGNSAIKRVGFFVLVGFYLVAGLNHFVMPDFYYPLIPPFFHFIKPINFLSGMLEVSLAISLLFNASRRHAIDGIIILLLLFLPAHFYFIQKGGCLSPSLCVPEWVGWFRLIVIHPILIYWAFNYRNYKRK